eukprot:CAMPEP_0194444998 /NCGR_PEP_ID=MMETSP0176-20130528/127601_1 /TAXON_ID=216777 /ORGANISM="Proboscia alata, Strain PI-D3" /LENGTH=77 /DNA_ID=CAMNT_0039271481 /DNA_START=1691 /DNA_END=1924 /DNA_ORIENTATION=+
MVKEVGIGAFAHCGIDSSNLPPHSKKDIYTFVGGEGEIPIPDVARVAVDGFIKDHPIRCRISTHSWEVKGIWFRMES